MTFTVINARTGARFLLDIDTLDDLLTLSDGVGKLVIDMAALTVTIW